MLPQVPIATTIFFGLTTLLTVFLFFKSSQYSKKVMTFTLLWFIVQGFAMWTGFYAEFNSLPPKFLLLVLPAVIILVLLLTTRSGKALVAAFDLRTLTYLHVVRIPVEIALWLLYSHHVIPELMTFEGRNFDILAGLTAPFIAYLYFDKQKLTKSLFLVWNIVSIALLASVIVYAFLSAPFPYQQLAFEQPNIGVFYFPFGFLPGFIVPVVLFSHFVNILALRSKKSF